MPPPDPSLPAQPLLRRLGALRWTLACSLLGLAVWFVSLLTDLDLFEQLFRFVASLERVEADEVFFLLVLLALGASADALLYRQRHRDLLELRAQKLRTLKATMRTVQDIHGNFLNQVAFFLFELEEAGQGGAHLEDMKQAVRQVDARLRALADLKDTPERLLTHGEPMIDATTAEGDLRGGA